MSSEITTFTALRLDDKDVNDPNSGFYTAQATTEQINNIPADAKGEGELLYNKTTGKLVLLNGVAGVWETVNSSDADGNLVARSLETDPDPAVEGVIYYYDHTNIEESNTLRTQLYDADEAAVVTKTIVTTPDADGNLVARSLETDPDPAVEGVIYYYDHTNIEESNTLRTQLYDADEAAVVTKTIVTTPDEDGNLVARSLETDPHTEVEGLIYYHKNDYTLRTQLYDADEAAVATKTIVTTTDPGGDYVVKSRDTAPTSNVAGIIYYDSNKKTLKTQNNTSTSTIVTTPDADGNLVARSLETDPDPAAIGMIYYNTTIRALKTFQITSEGSGHFVTIGKPNYGYYYSNDSTTTDLTFTDPVSYYVLNTTSLTFVKKQDVDHVINKYGVVIESSNLDTLYQVVANFSLKITTGSSTTGRSIDIRLREYSSDNEEGWVIAGSQKKCTLYNSDSMTITIASAFQFHDIVPTIVVEAASNDSDVTIVLEYPNFTIIPIA
jgi:hypothetical protein